MSQVAQIVAQIGHRQRQTKPEKRLKTLIAKAIQLNHGKPFSFCNTIRATAEVIEHCRKTDLSRASVGGDQRQREIDGIIVEALLREYLARRLGN